MGSCTGGEKRGRYTPQQRLNEIFERVRNVDSGRLGRTAARYSHVEVMQAVHFCID